MSTTEAKALVERMVSLGMAKRPTITPPKYAFQMAQRKQRNILRSGDNAEAKRAMWAAPKNVRLIATACAAECGVPVYGIFNNRRSVDPVCHARMLAMRICRDIVTKDYKIIAGWFGRERSATHHAITAIQDRCETDKTWTARYERVLTACNSTLNREL